MRYWFYLLTVSAFATSVGCSDNPKPAGTPSAAMIEADKAEQKKVEAEERGTPVSKKK